MPSPYTSERRREPIYVDDFGGRHIPPAPHAPGAKPRPTHQRQHRPRHEHDFVRGERPRRRAQTYCDPPSTRSPSLSPSPPPRQRRRHSRPPPAYDRYDDYYAPRRQRMREEDYFSDNRHNRPRQDPHSRHTQDRRGRIPPQEWERDVERESAAETRGARPRPERKESKWQKEAKEMFREYAVPVIKAEGGKLIAKQIGNLIAKDAA